MDNTFENGFMCGMLLSSNKSSGGSSIKEDKVFQYIVNNGIPYATVKITDSYKCVYVLVDGNEIPQINCMYTAKRAFIQLKPYVIFSENPDNPNHHDPTFTHCEASIAYASGVVVTRAMIFYKNNTPLWSSILGTHTRSDTYTTCPIYYEDTFLHVNAPTGVELTNEKERVAIYTSKNTWLKDTVKYAGDYFLRIIDDGSFPSFGKTTYLKIADDNGNPVSSLQTGYDIETHNYSYTWYKMKDPITGKQVDDLSKRPKITETSVTTNSINISSDTTVYFLASNSNHKQIHTDQSYKSLLDLDNAVITDVYKTHYKTVAESTVSMTWLN